jgi:hypothetical protein
MISASEFQSRLLMLDLQAVDFETQVDGLLAQADLSDLNGLLNAVFRFFENHPSEEAGVPGTLVHFAEHYYPAYKPTLLRSLSASPSASAVLMVNRILNSELSPSERSEYLSALAEVKDSPKASSIVRARAEHFIAYQHGKRT